MLGDIEQEPASTRPKYGLAERLDDSIVGNPRKKVMMLALLALASSLLLVIPDKDDDSYEVNASADDDQDGADGVAFSPSATSLQEIAEATGESSEADKSRLALATEAALAGAERSLSEGSAILSFADRMEAARVATTTSTGSTAAPTTSRPPTTARPATTAQRRVTTQPPAATEPPTSAAEEASTTSETSDPATASTEAAAGAEDATPATETTPADAAATDTSETAPATAESAPAEMTAPETTVPPTTAPPTTAAPTTAAASGWVDAGHGVSVPKVLLAIRYCESRDNYGAANPSSSARGAYQFLTGSWAAYGHKARYGVTQAHQASPAQQDEAALITWQRDGTRPWNASKSCWSKRI